MTWYGPILLSVLISWIIWKWNRGDYLNNVCDSFQSYTLDVSGECHYEPDVDIDDTSTIIKRHTGTVETYNVTTADGYILKVYRIPRKNPKGVVWLQHPVTIDSIIWVSQSNKSLAFLIYEAGYDVWMPNHRGTYSSPDHVSLNSEEVEYWDWSFHEIALYDYRTFNQFIVEKTNRTDIIFIGHSMASTASLVYASAYPEETKKNVKIFINMATPVYFEHVPLQIKIISFAIRTLKPVADLLEISSIGRFDNTITRMYIAASMYYPLNQFTFFVIDFLHGFTNGESDPQTLPLLKKMPRGFSLKMLVHYTQLVKTKSRFQEYDYGSKENKEIYGSEEPREYPLQDIQAPFYFIDCDRDFLATVQDNDVLYRRLPKRVKNYGRHKLTNFNHVNHFLGKHAKEKVYDHLLEFIESKVMK